MIQWIGLKFNRVTTWVGARRAIRWFLDQDLEERREAATKQLRDLSARSEDLGKRLERARLEHTAIKDAEERRRRLAEANRLADAAASLGNSCAALSLLGSAAASVAEAKASATETERRLSDFDAELDDLERAGPQIREDQNRLLAELKAVESARRRRLNQLYGAALASELASIAAYLLIGGDAKLAQSIHLDYYSAVASLAPLLLIAGLVEVATLGPPTTLVVPAFAVPALGALGASLYVLATHHAFGGALALTVWGLASTVATLLLYFVLHATSPRLNRESGAV